MDMTSGEESTTVVVRRMREDERGAVHAMFRRSFAALKRWFFFSWTPDVLVAERDGALVGAIVLETYPLGRGRTGGSVAWIFTAPEARGTGVGHRLLEAALELFDSHGCHEVTAIVESTNTGSSRLFATRGFGILSFGQQLRRYRWRLPGLWWRWRHLGAIGHFVWARPAPDRADSPSAQWWATMVLTALLGLFVLWRGAGFGALDPTAVVAVPVLCLLFLATRWQAMHWTAAAKGLRVRFRAWESGFLVSAVVAVTLGGFFPVAGGAYPVDQRWRYREVLPQLGPAAVAGVMPALVLTSAAWVLQQREGLPAAVDAWLSYAQMIGAWLVLFDTAVIFFPFFAFNGRRIRDWNLRLWAGLALLAVAVFGVTMYL